MAEKISLHQLGLRLYWFWFIAITLSFVVDLRIFPQLNMFIKKNAQSKQISTSSTTRKACFQPTATKALLQNSKKAAQSRAIIAGMFKDNNNVEGIYNIMKESVRQFESHMILLFENDSNDGQTAEQLRAICQRDENATCINLLGLQSGSENLQKYMPNMTNYKGGPVSPARFSRMAFFRNLCLNMVVRTAYDYFVFVDPDLLEKAWLPNPAEAQSIREYLPDHEIGSWGGNSRAWDPTSILSTVDRANSNNVTWSAVCFYGSFGSQLFHYDLLAFRLSNQTPIPPAAQQYRPTFSYEDWNRKFSAPQIRSRGSSLRELHEGMFLFRFSDHETFVPVSSCFNGLTVYSISVLRDTGCQYNENDSDCEHVALHRCLTNHYPDSVFLDPKSMVYYDTNSWDKAKSMVVESMSQSSGQLSVPVEKSERRQKESQISQPQSTSPIKLVKTAATPITTASTELNRTIVLLTGNVRGGEASWESLYKHVLDVNSADLGLMLGEDIPQHYQNATLLQRAKYIWIVPEFCDWADAMELIENKTDHWREKVFGSIRSDSNIFLGGAGSRFRGSGGIVFMFRYFLSQQLQQMPELMQQYDRFIVTRVDQFYLCSHNILELEAGYLWVPTEENFGGVCDRHFVVDRDHILDALDVLPPLLQHPETYNETALQQWKYNSESFLLLRWNENGLKNILKRFPRMMFLAAADMDPTRWKKPKNIIAAPGIKVKYDREYHHSLKTCKT